MSILLRFAMNPKGVELLYSNRIFDVLGQCQFMKAQIQDPTTTEMNFESSMELAERHQQLIMPTLRLIVAILCCYGGKNDTVLSKVCIYTYKSAYSWHIYMFYSIRPKPGPENNNQHWSICLNMNDVK